MRREHILVQGVRRCERASMAEKRKQCSIAASGLPSGQRRPLVRRRTPIGPEPGGCVTGADTLAGACLESVARRIVYVGIQKHGRPIGAKTFKVVGGSSIVSVALEALEAEWPHTSTAELEVHLKGGTPLGNSSK